MTERKAILLGSDHAAVDLKAIVLAHLKSRGLDAEDMGTHGLDSVDYTHYGMQVAEAVSEGRAERGILLCGTGLGMSMVANRFPGVRAALCNDLFSAGMCRRHNDANILVLGGRVLGKDLACAIVDTWLDTPFEGGRHQLRLDHFNQGFCKPFK
ncbi:ribose-5-phosphate isomerase [Desulfobotulus alkaliphilus]|uniref:Ribose-5-phosphate isomerase n=1 Tax=Desulfobotulus alkaliphilus TaxID=622671 RepID=A0A562S635_9BACT|nr:ribose 5-phosphate isomerase B [Desulfobotulus alkaliphilus]TWI76777.1 ribose-5-phosphate isomerase [Desulfobotulus alkaliphilus]